MSYTRRDFGKAALAAIPLPDALASVNSKFGGVQIGTITYSFRETNDLDAVIKMTAQAGLGEVELMSNHAESFAGIPSPARGPSTPTVAAPAAPSASAPPAATGQAP